MAAETTAENSPQGNENTEEVQHGEQGGPSLSLPEDPMAVLFHAPDLTTAPASSGASRRSDHDDWNDAGSEQSSEDSSGRGRRRRRRSRGGQSGGTTNDHQETNQSQTSHHSDSSDKPGTSDSTENEGHQVSDAAEQQNNSTTQRSDEDNAPVSRRRRRRRRGNTDLELDGGSEGDPENTITRVRAPRQAGGTGPENVTSLKGSTRLEAKRQRRRDSRNSGGRRRHIITEAEFLARRESVDRKMMVRQRDQRIQIAVMEDGVLAEHFVSNTTQDSMIGNVYLGKVQNVLPSMEAAFIDIGRGRNAVLYAGEVNWDAAQLDGKAKKIENALKSGDSVLVQVTKDPVGHKGARLTSQISLPGRYLVYVPGGSMTGISRKLPDVERQRLKKILKDHLPENAGVIVRTAAEGTSEDELMNDINRLRALWEGIEEKAGSKKILAPELLYAEPDLTIKVVRDVFNEDFSAMVVQGEEVWDNIEAYVMYVAPHLLDRLEKWVPEEHDGDDLFGHHRLDEQLQKALERKVFLPSGGSLVIDRTEAMTVVDVNTGKFTGSGGNLEETVTKNNLEAAEEMVRQLRLRDIGGIIVIDFIDMVLESNRDLVLRRLVECLGRDRTKHQVAEVTSLGLVQMTRKRMGTGLVEVFSEECEHCHGRGIVIHDTPVEHRRAHDSHGNPRQQRQQKNNNGQSRSNQNQNNQEQQGQQDKHSSGDDDSGSRRSRRRRGGQQSQPEPVVEATPATTEDAPEETDAQAAEREAKAEATRAALASIAAATQGAGQNGDEGAGPEKTEPAAVLTIAGEEVEVPRGRQRRGRRSSSSPQGAPASKKQTQQSASATPTDHGHSADAGGQGTLSIDGLNSALDQVEERKSRDQQEATSAAPAAEEKEPVSRPRRRRVASSDTASAAISTDAQAVAPAEGTSFTAESFAAGPEGTAEGETTTAKKAPMILGVGVSADEISSPGKKG